MKKDKKKSELKGPLRLLDEMYINAKIMLVATLCAAILIPLSVLSVCLIRDEGGELWYGGEPERVTEVILASAAVGIGGSLLLDIAHKKDSEK